MTLEEAIEYLNTLYMALAVFPNQQISLGNVDEMKESVSMAIKALEQEPILDKVKAEIEQLPRYGAKFPNRYLTVHVDIYEVLSIIDKYRGEEDETDN